MVEFEYIAQPPKKWTFEQPKLKSWIEKSCKGKVLNLFAGKVKLKVDEYRVDISEEFKPDIVCEAYKFVTTTDKKFDTIVLDPPYNLRKSREKYGGRYIGSFTKIKNELSRILNPKGKIITLGYDSVGMSKSRGFKKIAICLICHNGDHNDTIVLAEEQELKNNKLIFKTHAFNPNIDNRTFCGLDILKKDEGKVTCKNCLYSLKIREKKRDAV